MPGQSSFSTEGIQADHLCDENGMAEKSIETGALNARAGSLSLGRKQAEEALRKSQEQFRLLYEKAPLGIARIDSHTGRFLLINAKYCEILQRSEAEALQLDFQVVTHPEDLAADLENMRRLREGLCRSFQMDKCKATAILSGLM
jgi:PAS domain-containing protein